MASDLGTIRGLIELRDQFSARLTQAATRVDEFESRLSAMSTAALGAGATLTAAVTVPSQASGGLRSPLPRHTIKPSRISDAQQGRQATNSKR
jgi:hypothetical protein